MSDSSDKIGVETKEDLPSAPTQGTDIKHEEIAALSQEHRDYILQRHGSLDVDPVPAFGDADPYNWPDWKVPNCFHP